MIFNNGCNCFVEHDPLYVANVQHPSESVTRHYCENQEGSEQDPMYVVAIVPHPTGETSLMNDCKHPGRPITECESVLLGYESALDVQFTDTGWELTGDTVTDFFDNEETETSMSAIPTTFQPENYFTEAEEYDWSPSSRNYFINKHNNRSGLKGIVSRAMIDYNRTSCYEHLSKGEMYFHLLSTIIHHNSSRNESIHICSMLEHTITENKELLFLVKE
jgi:hypothetical protein